LLHGIFIGEKEETVTGRAAAQNAPSPAAMHNSSKIKYEVLLTGH
jgi:hypothetical protein